MSEIVQDAAPSATPKTGGATFPFDAERVTKKSRRWLVVLLAIFLGIVGAVGIAVWQGKAYFKNIATERAVKQKREQDESAAQRAKKTFDLPGAELPDSFGGAKLEPVSEAIPVIRKQPSVGPTMTTAVPVPPARRSMLVDFESAPAEVRSTQDEATEIAKAITSALGTDAPAAPGSLLGGSSTAATAAATQARPKSIQEFAKRAPGALTTTGQALAVNLGNRSYLLARGASIPCTLQTQLNSNVPGPAKCLVSQNIFSDDGKVLLVERGSSIDGEYKSTLKTGDSRLAVLWSRIKTPNGVVIDVESPATDSVGSVGIDGEIDNHWMQRIGAAFMLSLVDDAIQLQTAKQGAQSAGANGAARPYTSTTGTTKSIAEKVLESTINIAPTLTRNRGARLMVLVNRDLWFDQVYELSAR